MKEIKAIMPDYKTNRNDVKSLDNQYTPLYIRGDGKKNDLINQYIFQKERDIIVKNLSNIRNYSIFYYKNTWEKGAIPLKKYKRKYLKLSKSAPMRKNGKMSKDEVDMRNAMYNLYGVGEIVSSKELNEDEKEAMINRINISMNNRIKEISSAKKNVVKMIEDKLVGNQTHTYNYNRFRAHITDKLAHKDCKYIVDKNLEDTINDQLFTGNMYIKHKQNRTGKYKLFSLWSNHDDCNMSFSLNDYNNSKCAFKENNWVGGLPSNFHQLFSYTKFCDSVCFIGWGYTDTPTDRIRQRDIITYY
jgi:hypothetical protein